MAEFFGELEGSSPDEPSAHQEMRPPATEVFSVAEQKWSDAEKEKVWAKMQALMRP